MVYSTDGTTRRRLDAGGLLAMADGQDPWYVLTSTEPLGQRYVEKNR